MKFEVPKRDGDSFTPFMGEEAQKRAQKLSDEIKREPDTCPHCAGDGESDAREGMKCAYCKGTGKVQVEPVEPTDTIIVLSQKDYDNRTKHTKLKTAMIEADRLCKKEMCDFYLFYSGGKVWPEVTPKWEGLE